MLKSHNQIHLIHSGFFFPPLPEKAFFESRFGWSDSSFAKVRRVDLQAYMRTIAGHPVLRSSEELRLFLTHTADLTSCGRWQQMLARPKGDAIKSLLSGLGLSAGDAAAAGGAAAGGGGGDAAQQGTGVGGGAGSGGAGAGGRGGGLGFRMLKMKQSLMGVVAQRPKRAAALSAEEQQLRTAKDMFRWGGCLWGGLGLAQHHLHQTPTRPARPTPSTYSHPSSLSPHSAPIPPGS
jgi:hypothetical protein